MLNLFITAEQERIRELVATMWHEEYPLAPADLKLLTPFVRIAREEIVEDVTPGKRAMRRVEYFVLNDRGRRLYRKWLEGGLDKLVEKQAMAAG